MSARRKGLGSWLIRGLVGWTLRSGVGWAEEVDPSPAPPSEPPGDEEVLIRRPPGNPPPTASLTTILVDERLPHGATVAEVLERVPGVRIQELGGLGDFSAVGIRGSSLRQVQVFLDGVPLNPDGGQVVNLAELPLRAFSSISVWRGAAPPRTAAAPIGGVVELRTAEPGLHSVQATTGSWGSVRADGLSLLGWGSTDLLLYADALHTRGDFIAFSDNGTRYNLLDDARASRTNNEKDQLSTLLRLRHRRGNVRVHGLSSTLLRVEGLPGPVTAPARMAGLKTTRALSVLALEAQAQRGVIESRLYHQGRVEQLSDPQAEIGLSSGSPRTRFDSLGLTLHGMGAWNPRWLPALTLDLRGDQAKMEVDPQPPAEGLTQTHQRIAAAGAISSEVLLVNDRLRLSPVLQLASLHGLGVQEKAQVSQFAANPRVAARYQFGPSVAFRASAGRFFRPPDLSELYGDRGATVGNPNLLPERGTQWDLGLQFGSPAGKSWRMSGEIGHFWSDVHDQIIYVTNGQGTAVPINFGRAWTQGLELGLDTAVSFVEFRGALTWMPSRNLSELPELMGKVLPRVPPLSTFTELSVHRSDRLRLGHTWSYTAPNYWDATNVFLSPPRSIHGVFGRVRMWRSWESELSVLNLFDHYSVVVPQNPLRPEGRATSEGSMVVEPLTDFVGYPLPGRTFLFSLRWSAPQKSAPAPH